MIYYTLGFFWWGCVLCLRSCLLGLYLSSVHEISQLCWGAFQTLWAVSRHWRSPCSHGPHSVSGDANEDGIDWCDLQCVIDSLWRCLWFPFRIKGRSINAAARGSGPARVPQGEDKRLDQVAYVASDSHSPSDMILFKKCHLIRRSAGSLVSSRKSWTKSKDTWSK